MHIPRSICNDCSLEMRIEKNSLIVEMMSPDEGLYKISGDLYKCPCCGYEIMTSFASQPLAEHWESTYAAIPVDLRAEFGCDWVERDSWCKISSSSGGD